MGDPVPELGEDEDENPFFNIAGQVAAQLRRQRGRQDLDLAIEGRALQGAAVGLLPPARPWGGARAAAGQQVERGLVRAALASARCYGLTRRRGALGLRWGVPRAHVHARLDLDLDSLSPDTVVADVIPNPPDTNLVRDARAKGCQVIDGLGMLVNQGVIGIKHWTGVDPDPKVMRAALEEVFG